MQQIDMAGFAGRRCRAHRRIGRAALRVERALHSQRTAVAAVGQTGSPVQALKPQIQRRVPGALHRQLAHALGLITLSSYRQVRLHQLVRQGTDLVGDHQPALVQDAQVARHAARERQLLLDQQHGEIAALRD